jgi:hypothetical protein
MSKPTHRELATKFDLWCKFVLLEEQVSEREFNEMSVDEKLLYRQTESMHSYSTPFNSMPN